MSFYFRGLLLRHNPGLAFDPWPPREEGRDFQEVELLIVCTGQHYDYAMSRVFFSE